jgi:nucleotide-binding universal stress UspA family protein
MRIQPKTILCAIDFSDFSHLILSYGRALAAEFHARLVVCHILPDMIMLASHGQAYIPSQKVTEERLESTKTLLTNLVKEQRIDAEILIAQGHPADEITRIVQEKSMDLVIAATHGGSGIKRFLIGSVTDRLVKTLTCPLLVLHAQEDHPSFPDVFRIPLDRILVGCDFSPESDLAVEHGLSLAQEFQAELHLVHVIKPHKHIEMTSSDYLKLQEGDYLGWNQSDFLALQQKATDDEWERRSRLLNHIERQLINMVPEESKNWCTPVITLLEGQPYTELIRYADKKKVDMMVLGVHGHSLLEQFLVGSTTDRIIGRATCPVLAVREPLETK